MSKSFKIYGTKYPLETTASAPPDAYGFKNEIVDDQPRKGKKVGYVTYEDGSLIECYTKFNPLIVVLPVIALLLVAGGVTFYLLKLQPKDVNVGDVIVKTGTDNNVVTYNGFMSLNSGEVDIDFTNGDEEAKIQLKGNGIKCEPVTIAPNESLTSLPVTYDTEEGLVNATLIIQTATSSSEQQVVVEIPDNNTGSSPDSGMDGYWKGEAVYGTDTLSTER